jgi:hypothetical protein
MKYDRYVYLYYRIEKGYSPFKAVELAIRDYKLTHNEKMK